MRGLWRTLSALACLLGGAAVAVCTVALHGLVWGLALGVLATSAILRALPGGWWARLPFAIGWVLLLWRAATPRDEGDYLVSSDLTGYVLLVFGMVVLAAGFVGVVRRPVTPAGQ